MIATLIHDVRYAVRTLVARPGFAVAAIVTLAIGIGANAAIFSVIDSLVLRPLPYPHGDRLVAIHNAYPKTGEFDAGSTIPDYLDQRQQAPSLADSAIYQYATFNLVTDAAPLRLIGTRATPTLFPTLGTQPLLGRVLADDDAVAGRDHVVVLSFDAWQNQFAGDPSIVGRDLRLDHDVYRVVGVMPKGFFFPDRDVQLWTPYVIRAEQLSDAERGNSDVESVGLLKPGATIVALETEFRTIVARNATRSSQLRTDYALTGFEVTARPLQDEWFGSLRQTLWLLQGMVALLLLVSSVNVVNLVLVRFSARQRDFALRSALGADRRRLTRQIIIESSLLALLGGGAGLLLAAFGLPLLGHVGFAAMRRWSAIDFGIRASVIGFVVVLSISMGLLLGAVTALSLRRGRSIDLLRAGGQTGGASPGAGRLRNALVVGQFALTLVLLVAAGLLLKSFLRLQQTDPGFVSSALLTARLDLPRTDYANAEAQAGYYERLLAAARAMPGVESATYTSSLPFDGHLGTSGYVAEAYAGADGTALTAQRQSVDVDYFATLSVPLIEGRAFGPGDTADSPAVVIVDETMAGHLWLGRSALGWRLRLDDDRTPWMTVVGVARAVRQNDLSEQPKRDAMYWPLRQHPVRYGELVVKSGLPPVSLVPELRAAAITVDSQLPIYDIQTLDERIAHSLDRHRAPTVLLGVFAMLALVLAAVGIYGVLAYALAQRTSELGVRKAIGAGTREIFRLVIGSGMRLCAFGVALGGLGGVTIGGLLRTRLYLVDPVDVSVFASVIGLLIAVAWVACWLPARRAARIDPMVALRHE